MESLLPLSLQGTVQANARTDTMATNEETRFALGLFAAIIIVSLGVLVLRFAGDAESTRENPAQSSRTKSVPPQASKVSANTREIRSELSQPQPVEVAARAVPASSASSSVSVSLSADAGTQPLTAVPTIDSVPLAFFDSTASASELPDVIEKYRNRVVRGALFMNRLEAIVTDKETVSNDSRHNLSMTFTARSKSKRLSYKSVDVTKWIEATFDSVVSPVTRDVLVDVRRIGDSATESERIALFFASVQKYADKQGFLMDADVGDNDAILRVYAVTDELRPLGEARLTAADMTDQ